MSELTALNTLATSAQYQQHREFWTQTLRSIPDDFKLQQNWQSYALPYGPRPEVSLQLTGSAAEALGKLSQGKTVNALVVVLSALAHVLRTYSNIGSVFIDTPRLAGELASAHADCIPLVMPPSRDATVREYLNLVREVVQGSYTYQDFPIADFARKLLETTRATNVYVRFEEIHEDAAPSPQHDLTIAIRRNPTLEISLRANERVFTHHYLEHLGRHLRNVIAGLGDLDKPLKSIALLDEQERYKLQQSSQRFPVSGTVLDHLSQQALAHAKSVAVTADSTTLTYDELEERSSRLAAFLQTEYGIGRGDPVGLIADRSGRWIIGILAILKAGGVYVPLDPEYPPERLRFMIEDAGIRALLVHSQFLHLLTEAASIPMFALDLQLDALEPASPSLETRPGPNDDAYIIYTSGSTGAPKGVALSHRGLLNMAQWHVEAFGFEPSDRVMQLYSPGFDGSLMEIFVTLLAGARLVLARPEVIADPPQFAQFLHAQGVTTLNAAPDDIGVLDWEALPTLKRVISAGDDARVDDAVELSRTRTFHNSYGPTETSVCVADYVVDPKITYGTRIPVGKPIRNASIYLLGEDLQCVPEGCMGEVCISGPMLARGYLHRDDLTNEAFVAHPFEPGERLYRSGDLGVWLPDGNLELLGRRDSQVKLRGQRIELQEIEAALLKHSDVKEAAVLVRDHVRDSERLVAFVAPSSINIVELREHLRTLLPDFMVPAAIERMDRLPLDAQGKVDRKQLSARASRAKADIQGGSSSGGDLEGRLGKIWAELLGRDHIGAQEDLFELGADSILVIQAVSRAQQAGIRVSAQAHFAHPTVASLATVAVVADAAAERTSWEPVVGRTELGPIQQWFFDQGLQSPQHYNQSRLIEVPASLEPGIVEQALAALLEHHDALRLSFSHANDSWEALHAPPPLEARVETTSLEGLPPAEQATVFESVANRLQESFDLSQPPLLRAHLFRFGARRPSRLLLIAHHLVIDAVSWGILLEDLYNVCGQLEAAQPVQLPEKTAAFRDWTQRLKSLAATDFPGRDYWATQAARTSPSFKNISTGTSASADSILLRFDESLTLALQDAARLGNVQINDVLLTALWLAFRDWRG
ncbi:MAG TPA: amino acid adenylation domain-containing protein, partial [Steroidobacteraceae bacterium]